jgi:anti-sigma B factor antagonist
MELLSIDLARETPPVLYVRGEIDMATAGQLRSALEDAMAAASPVVVDMRDVSFIDLFGVRVILEAAGTGNGHGPLRLVHAARVARLLDLIGLDEEKASLDIRDGR